MFKLLMLFLRTMFYGSVMKCINQNAVTFTFLGGQFQIGDAGAPESFTTISQVESVDFGSSKRDIEETTSADNTDTAKRKTGRLKDFGMCTVVFFFNPNDASHQQLSNADDGFTHDFKCINPGGFGSRTFVGIVETFGDHKLELGKATKKTVKIAISGPITSTIPGA